MLTTNRLILRPWQADDAEALYQYAQDPLVGPIAGWAPHTSVEDSRGIITQVLSGPYTYAVVLKETGQAIGSIGLMIGKDSNLDIGDDEAEIGYWIGVPYWGRGLIPEAMGAVIHYGFEQLNLNALWCGYFDGNNKSWRVQQKCGFTYQYSNKDIPWPLMGDIRTEHVTRLTKVEYNYNRS